MKYGYGPDAPSICADEYEWHCSEADCTEHSHEEDDFLKCESCARPVCAEHAHRIHGDEMPFCGDCFHCYCGRDAVVACDSCGELRCLEHGYIYDGGEERQYLCQNCFPTTPQASLKLKEHNPFRGAKGKPAQKEVIQASEGVA